MIKQPTFSFSLDCSKMVISIRKATKAMRKLGEVNRLRNKQYLRKIRKVPRKQKKAYLKIHSREIYHLRRLRGGFCKSTYNIYYIPHWVENLGKYVNQRELNKSFLSTWQMNSSTFEPLPPIHPGEENIEHVCNPIGE